MHKLRKRGEIDVVSKLERQLAAANKRAEEAEKDAKRWRTLPAFLEKYQINYVSLLRDIDTYIYEAMKND